MSAFAIKARTTFALGWLSVARVISYRIGVRFGLNPVRRLAASPPSGTFFMEPAAAVISLSARRGGYEYLEGFGCELDLDVTQPPDWFQSVTSGSSVIGTGANWWEIRDFDPAVGDIKAVWELSRFDWVLAAAQHAAVGDEQALNRLNLWLQDWSEKNPPYKGPNWKCGQECSIRVLHLLAAALILDQESKPQRALIQLVEIHLRRIAPTIRYAVGQDNNHGTSEAAALFIGGAWLAANEIPEGEWWCKLGRKWLEDRVGQLIQPDGSFSQYSLNYHRLMLDTLCLVEVTRRQLKLPEFSEEYMCRVSEATRWLFLLIDPATGDGPNVGANDGAHILKLSDTDYRDFRPSVQLAAALFLGERAYPEDGSWNAGLSWLGVVLPTEIAARPSSAVSDDGGFLMMRRESVMALLRYPRFRFRPSQADLLHVDLWVNGENFLRDAGTFSYNTADRWLNYFGGTEGHNTVQFDGRDQMPRLSRFLFGAWPKIEELIPLDVDQGVVTGGASFRDWQGAYHRRVVKLDDGVMEVTDEIRGFKERAVLRWRLSPGDWSLMEVTFGQTKKWCLQRDDGIRMELNADVPVQRCEIVEGWESRYYLQMKPLPVVELEVRDETTLQTRVSWAE